MNQTATDGSYGDIYQQYLQRHGAMPPPDSAARDKLDRLLNQTPWEAPVTSADQVNTAVVALVLAEAADDAYLRSLYLETALDALQVNEPLAAAHRCLMGVWLQEPGAAGQALATLAALANAGGSGDASDTGGALGLIYLPPTRPADLRGELLRQLLAGRAEEQALLLTVEALRRSPLAFYSPQGLRFLQLAVQHYPQVAALHRQLGLANLLSDRPEGLVNLHRARVLDPHDAKTYQALQLAYRTLTTVQAAHWQTQARQIAGDAPEWRWTQLPPDSPITYIPYDGVLLAVEASLRSIVTSVLLAQGTWFEAELALWRQQLQPGMVVIDVGANVGVYTFSAAVRVGREGRVLAVEPGAGCVQCLEETCRLNGLEWVTICAAAASDHTGTAQLAEHGASELNELVPSSQGGVTVPCITLDSLVEEQRLTRVDWLKIDAEGHELPVLRGGTALLQRFRPKILYENVAAGQGANVAVGQWLQQAGYQLYRYRPFVAELEPVTDLDQGPRSLNLVALPAR
ncbi:MAG: FkbM family methyltransferase, partial [Cyanobacteria bacterium P01_A01_bin.135]